LLMFIFNQSWWITGNPGGRRSGRVGTVLKMAEEMTGWVA